MNASPLPPASLLTCVALAILTFAVALAANRDCFEIAPDGAAWQTYIDYQARDRAPFSQLGVDAHQGDFDAYYPLVGDFTPPGALYRLLGIGRAPGPAANYAVYSFALALVVFLLGRVFGLHIGAALLGAVLAAFFFPPLIVHHMAQTFWFIHLNPHWMQLMILSTIIVIAEWALDGKWSLSRLLLIGLPAVCVTVEILSVGAMVIFTPAVALYGGAAVLASRTRQEAVQRLAAALLAVLVVAASGQAAYLYGLERYSAYHVFAYEFDSDYPVVEKLSIVFAFPFGTILISLGLVGAVLAAAGPRGQLRKLAYAHLAASAAFFCACAAFYVLTRRSGYRTSSPFYFETTFMPFAAMFCAFAIVRVARFGVRREGRWGGRLGTWLRASPSGAVLWAFVALVAGYNFAQLAFATPDLCADAQVYANIRSSRIVDILHSRAAIEPGAAFRGNVITIDWPGAAPFSSADMNALNRVRFQETGNEHRFIGLWRYAIPSMYQYFTFITAPYYLILTEFLSRPQDIQTRSGLVLTRIDAKILRLWGVRYVITDHATDEGLELTSLPLSRQRTLRLIELTAPNLGNYSPTSVRQVADFHAGLILMHDPTFDGRKTVVTDIPIAAPLVEASNVRLTYETSGFRIEAQSAGQSVLVLPPQFSRCWSAVGSGGPRLFRADLMQLGVLFSGNLDARLVFRYGPLFASTCRLEDVADIEQLKIAEGRVLPRILSH